MPGQVYAVASGKGGVGKTTTVVNLGVVLRRVNHSVALVDADLGMANLGAILGVDGDRTIHDVLAGDATVEAALVEEAEGFAVLPGSRELTAYASADPKGLRDVVETLAESYDFVLLDTGAGISYEDVLPLGLADGVVLVTTPDPAAIGDTGKTAELAALAGSPVEGLVVTHASPTTDARHVAEQVGVDLLGVVPHDPSVRESTATGRPLEAMAPDSPAAVAYRELAGELRGEPIEEPTRAADEPDPAAESAAGDAPDGADSGGADADAAPADATGADADVGAADTGGDADADDTAEESAEADAAGAADAEGTSAADADEGTPEPEGETATAEAVDEEAPESDVDEATAPTDAAGTDEAAPSGDDETDAAEEAGDDDEDLDDYLEEFEDEGTEDSGGFFSRLARLFR